MSSTKLTLSASAQRVLAIATAGALLPLGFAGAASAQTATPSAVDISKNLCASNVPDAGYTDISASSDDAKLAINCISGYGIAKGTTATTYNPTGVVNRSQMALFLTRLATAAGAGEALDDSDAGFTDIGGETAEAQTAINQLANLGVAQGKTATTYAPGAGVSRAQMASFINRLQSALEAETDGSSSFDTDTDYFSDDDGLGAEDDINAIAGAGIAQGTDGKYNPTNPVSRQQMAQFLARHGQVNVAAGNFDSKYPPVTSNQTFVVTPTNAATLSLADETAATAAARDADNRTYSVATAAAGAVHQIVLVPAADVTVGANGVVTFADAESNGAGNNQADFGTVDARISAVNSVPIALASQLSRATAIPVAGTITFTVEGNAAESVVPVVFFDANSDSNLNLDAANSPVAAEVFGVGGATTYINPTATSQVLGAQTVQAVNKGANQFDANNLTFSYDANDTFEVANAGTTTYLPATLDEFEARLSRNDTVEATYSATAGASSSFKLVDDSPVAPATVTAEAGTGANSNDITVTVPIGSGVDSVVIQRATVTGGGTDENNNGTVGTYATITTVTPTTAQRTAGSVTYVDDNVAVGVYRYQAAVVSDAQQSTFRADTNNEGSTAPAADVTGPQSSDARVSTDAGFSGVADAGDTSTIAFNEALSTPAAGATLRVQDSDGTVLDLVNGSNATFSLNASALTYLNGAARPAGTVLTVALTGAQTPATAGTTVGLQYSSAVLVNSSGVTDVAGNRYDIVGSTDKTLDVAANVTTAPVSTLTASGATPSDGDNVLDAGEAFVITFNRAINPAGVDTTATTLTFTDGDGTVGKVTCGIDCTLTGAGTVLTIPNGGLPTVSAVGGVAGYQGTLTVSATTGLVASDNGQAVATPFSITV